MVFIRHVVGLAFKHGRHLPLISGESSVSENLAPDALEN